ncbi:MAG: NUDIX hydrolase [Acidimicrobiales bacterium]
METQRRRVAAIIRRDDHVLMVRERMRDEHGRHAGQEIWTLPGGGVEADETLHDAVRREVHEEVGLVVDSAEHVFDYPYFSGVTACFQVTVAPGEPRLGVDPLECDCPRMVGLAWMPVGDPATAETGHPVPVMFYAAPTSG